MDPDASPEVLGTEALEDLIKTAEEAIAEAQAAIDAIEDSDPALLLQPEHRATVADEGPEFRETLRSAAELVSGACTCRPMMRTEPKVRPSSWAVPVVTDVDSSTGTRRRQ